MNKSLKLLKTIKRNNLNESNKKSQTFGSILLGRGKGNIDLDGWMEVRKKYVITFGMILVNTLSYTFIKLHIFVEMVLLQLGCYKYIVLIIIFPHGISSELMFYHENWNARILLASYECDALKKKFICQNHQVHIKWVCRIFVQQWKIQTPTLFIFYMP